MDYRRLLLTLPLLLAACGQTSPQAGDAPGASVTAEQRAAFLRATPTPPEAVAQRQITDLADTLPGGKKIASQAIDKSVPIILVHGMTGFGRDELLGLVHYWGGVTYDVQEDLRALGYKVYTASVGPFSSNWDRAAELYAQIKGGCVDYGPARAAEFGHTRSDPAKCYPGFYPEWDAQHPVNLIGHSQGGPTVRLLVKLLDDGSPANADGNNLYAGGRAGWVRNLMTISSPSDGSPAADNLQVLIPQLQKIIVAVAAVAGNLDTVNRIYDFDLGQYGLRQEPGETFGHYLDRVSNSRVMTSKDSAGWDLRPDGAKEQNAFIGRSKVTKYFSWATNDTSPGLLTGWHYPNVTMGPELVVTSYPYPRPLPPGMGNVYGTSQFGGVTYDRSWWPNDGIVPTNYSHAPIGQQRETYTGQATQPGRWYVLGTVQGYDHVDIVGNLTLRDVRQFYLNQAAFLNSQ